MMTAQDRETITSFIVELCREMFDPQANSFEELSYDGASGQESRLAASVGLGGSELRGALTIVGPNSFFRGSYPAELGQPSDEDLADWAREAVNQLLGRMKNRFAGYGVNFNISTPTALRGEHLRMCPADAPSRITRSFRIRGERLDLHFHIERDDGKGLLDHAGPPMAASAEGAALLF